MNFNDFLNEKLITFGGKAYPKFGNVVIGGGSYIKDANYIKVKSVGNHVKSLKTIDSHILKKDKRLHTKNKC